MAEIRNPSAQGADATKGTQKTTQEGLGSEGRGMETYRSTSGETSRWPTYGTQASYGSPLGSMRRFFDEMDRLFFGDLGANEMGRAQGPAGAQRAPLERWAPRMDIFERGDSIVLRADLPGLRSEDVRVDVSEGMLTISGERKQSFEANERGVYRSECSYGSFQRSVQLPQGVDPEAIQANFENGVLEVTVPAPKQMRGKTVPIQAGRTEGGKPEKPETMKH
jgi:HSP20 family protein